MREESFLGGLSEPYRARYALADAPHVLSALAFLPPSRRRRRNSMRNVILSRNTRNPAIELYRIFLMFGIVFLHCVCQGAYAGGWLKYTLGLCVPGFVFITGWFGISFSLSKVIRLYAVAIYASLLAPLVGGDLCSGHYWREVLRVWDAPSGFWFLHAYVLLMMLAPLINKCFELIDIREKRVDAVKALVPLICIVFVWSAVLNYNHARAFIPSPNGVMGLGVLNFMGVYVVGRYARLSGIGDALRLRTKALLLVVLLLISMLTKSYVCNGNTLFGVCLPGILFLLVKDVKIPHEISRLVLFLSPLMFAVYCIHGTIYFPFTEARDFAFIEWMKQCCVHVGLSIRCSLLFTALAAFGVGVGFALVPAAIGWILRKHFPRFTQSLDASYSNVCEVLSDALWFKHSR